MDHGGEKIIFTIICFPLFLVAIMVHEVAHGYIAYLQGDPTAKYAGRLTLNPISHLDPVGTFCFIMTSIMGMGFGWAKPVPINPVLFKEYRAGIIKVSLAGVGANMAMALVTAIIIKILVMTNVVIPMGGGVLQDYIFRILFWFMMFNVVLFVFNLIPIPPLDGSKVLMMLLPREQAIALARIEPYGMFIIFGLLMLGVLNVIFSVVGGAVMKLMIIFLNV